MLLNKVKIFLIFAVSDIHVKMRFNNGAPVNTMAYAFIISDRLFHFVSDGSKITNIV